MAESPGWEADKKALRKFMGQRSRALGKQFEDRLTASFDYYDYRGYASVEKTPEPMKILKPLDAGRFIACFTKKAQADYSGTMKGGRRVIFEAKFTAMDRLKQEVVDDNQAKYLRKHAALGARCYVVAGYASGNVYRVPWEVWDGMKAHFGRKYVTEADLTEYRVRTSWNDTLLLLG